MLKKGILADFAKLESKVKITIILPKLVIIC